MNEVLIERIIREGDFPHPFAHPRLVETHISFVLLGRSYAYKFKKAVKFSFLDFSTLAKRKQYCEREVELNSRLTSGIYLGVIPVWKDGKKIAVDGPPEGQIIDYGIRMKRLRGERQMHLMLEKGQVTEKHILTLAEVIRDFHQRADIIHVDFDRQEMASRFNDIRSILPFIRKELGVRQVAIIRDAIQASDRFLRACQHLFQQRMQQGFVRDVHGDFHSRNIFLYARPIIFDCIEFNDAYRRMDVLDELAFFCMDLDAEGYNGLSQTFLRRYFYNDSKGFGKPERKLFLYYKAYRANVRAKVNALHAMEPDEPLREAKLREAEKYLALMHQYVKEF